MVKYELDEKRRLILKIMAVSPLLCSTNADAFWFGLLARLFVGNVARQIPRAIARVASRSVARRLLTRSSAKKYVKGGRRESVFRDAYNVYSKGESIVDIVKLLKDNGAWANGQTNNASIVLSNKGLKPVSTDVIALTMSDIRNDESFKVIFDPVEIEPNSALILETELPIGILPGKKTLELSYGGGTASRIYREILVAGEKNSGKHPVPLGEASRIFDLISN